MTTTPKVLGQLQPVNTTLADLYTVPAATSTTVSSIVITNTTTGVRAFRVSIAVAGAADNIKQYIYYDLPIAANDTFVFTGGVTLQAGDKIRVKADAGNTLTFSVYGIEVA